MIGKENPLDLKRASFYSKVLTKPLRLMRIIYIISNFNVKLWVDLLPTQAMNETVRLHFIKRKK